MEDLDLAECYELGKEIFNQIALTLGEDRAEEFIATLIDLLKGAAYEMRGKTFKLKSMEIILNDYFHAKREADGESLFHVVKDYKKLKAFEIIKNKGVLVDELKRSASVDDYNMTATYYDTNYCKLGLLNQDEYDLLKEVL